MRQSILYISTLVIILKSLLFSGCNTGQQKKIEIGVFAAISLTDALTEIGEEYSKKSKQKVYFNFAASTTLQRQIEKGASADVFISASPKQVDALESLGLLEGNSRKDILTNQLVIISHKNAEISINNQNEIEQDSISKIAIGQPDIVPAGAYTKEALTHLNLWDRIHPKLIFATNVRATLAYVSTGNVDLAFVYETDAKVSNKVKVVYQFPPNTHSPITYPVVVLKNSSQKMIAQEFIAFLTTPTASTIFNGHGFTQLLNDSAHQSAPDTLQ